MNTPAATLQLLTGMKLHTLLAAVILHNQGLARFSEQDVAAIIGRNRKTARTHLHALAAVGLIFYYGDKQHRPWRILTDQVRQLPLPLQLLNDGNAKVGKSYPLSPPFSFSINEESSNFPTGEEEKRQKVGKSYPLLSTGNAPTVDNSALLAELTRSGIGRNMWTRIAELPWVTPAYIRAHVAEKRANNEPVSYIVRSILDGDGAEGWTLCAECGKPTAVPHNRSIEDDVYCLYCNGAIKH